ncbi:MAG: protein-L-isoaspartate(D-aspartate) O-methyltransferase [Dehalococcoidia bacterium]|nr:protein-L-isoaspartate(D-aspartate) O-methyltransferase [Dehalococcoidia bacterium]
MPTERARDRLLRKLSGEISDKRVLDAIAAVRRERFVRQADRHAAYEDVALGIAAGQTISQPTIVAIMLQEMELKRFDRVLEIGTGSGYQTAILGELAREVVTVERVPQLAESAREILERMGYDNVRVEDAGPILGWPAGAPYDAIVVAAAAPRLPRTLLGQLEIGGRLVIPVGNLREQSLMKVVRTMDGVVTRALGACRFVPLIGRDAWSESDLSS